MRLPAPEPHGAPYCGGKWELGESPMGTWGISKKITGRFSDGGSLKQFSEQRQPKGSAFANGQTMVVAVLFDWGR